MLIVGFASWLCALALRKNATANQTVQFGLDIGQIPLYVNTELNRLVQIRYRFRGNDNV
jgi:hypothetical protein